MSIQDYIKGFKKGLKINNDDKEPHWDNIKDVREELDEIISKIVIPDKIDNISGMTQAE